MNMRNLYVDQHVVITGGASGIGRALARSFAQRRARVSIVDCDQAAMERFCREGQAYGWEIKAVTFDLSQTDGIPDLVQQLALSNGGIQYWINNAGIADNAAFEELSREVCEQSFRVNVYAVIESCRAVIKVMRQQSQGTIVNVASIAGHLAPPYMSLYAATKHAVVGFSRSLQQELSFGDEAINLVMVSPGFVDTGMIKRGQDSGFPQWLSFMLSTPEQVAQRTMKGLDRGEGEISPTWNGRWMQRSYGLFPQITINASKVLLTKSIKDLILNRYQPPRLRQDNPPVKTG